MKKVTVLPSRPLLRARRTLMDGRATRDELVKAMTAWADALDQAEPMLPWMPLLLLDRAVELEGEGAALRVADHLAQVEELDLTVKALRLLGDHDLRPWAVEVAVRVLVGESHLPFVSPVVVMRAVEAGPWAFPAATRRLVARFRRKYGFPS